MDVNVFDMPVFRESHDKDQLNGPEFNHKTKGLVIIETMQLCEATSYKSCFVATNGAISMSFYFKHPFATKNVHIRSVGN